MCRRAPPSRRDSCWYPAWRTPTPSAPGCWQAPGSVTARTWYALRTTVPLTVPEKRYTGRERTLVSLVFGTHRVKFFSNSSIEGANYDKITSRRPLSLLGIPLPFTVVTEKLRFYETVPAPQSPAQAEARAEAALTAYLHQLTAPYGAVRSTLCGSRQKGDVLVVTLNAECEEEESGPASPSIHKTRTEDIRNDTGVKRSWNRESALNGWSRP